MTTIHTRIKQRREALGLTMKALADMVGVAAWQTIQQWEREDGTAPKRERLAAVADALQTTPEELLFGNEQPEPTKLQQDSHTELSSEAVAVGKAFDKLKSAQERETLLALLRAFGAL